MGKNVATLEFEFYIKLLKRHTKELFLLINEKNVLIFMYIFKSTYKCYLKNDNKIIELICIEELSTNVHELLNLQKVSS